jgi:YD repeat-containing protein
VSDTRNIAEVEDKPKEGRAESGNEAARGEVDSGMEKHSADTKDYMEARKGGLRDKHTSEILGAQPEFFDSATAQNKFDLPADSAGSIHKDANGRVDQVEYPNGASSSVKYDQSGNPTEVKAEDNSKWRQDQDGWNHYDKAGRKDQHHDGTVDVNHKGDVTFTENGGYKETANADGSLDKWYPDRSGAFQNKDGDVTSILHKDGTNTFPEYDKEGKATKLTDVDANGKETGSWVKDGDRWSIRDKDGKETGTFKGDVEVTADGDITRKGVDSRTNEYENQTLHRDGTLTRQLRDGSTVETDHDGRLTNVKYPDGKSADFKYDDKGDLQEFTDKKGITHTKDQSGWKKSIIDKNGTSTDMGAEDGHYKTNANGDVQWESKDQRVTDTTHANGTRDRLEYWDGDNHKDITKQTTWDEKGRMTSGTYPGEHSEDKTVLFGYDKNGKLESVSDASKTERGMHGDHWLKGHDGTWTKYDENGNVALDGNGNRREAKSVAVGPNGEIVVTNKDGSVDKSAEPRKY